MEHWYRCCSKTQKECIDEWNQLQIALEKFHGSPIQVDRIIRVPFIGWFVKYYLSPNKRLDEEYNTIIGALNELEMIRMKWQFSETIDCKEFMSVITSRADKLHKKLDEVKAMIVENTKRGRIY